MHKKMESGSFIEKVRLGLEQLKNDEVTSHEEVKKMVLLKKIEFAKIKSEEGKTYSTEEAREILSKRITK